MGVNVMEWERDTLSTIGTRWLDRGFSVGSSRHHLFRRPDINLWAFIIEEDGRIYWIVEGPEDTPKSKFSQAYSVEDAKAAAIVTYRLRAKVV